jgi:RNA polymerase sigma factor (sigma-70 family)
MNTERLSEKALLAECVRGDKKAWDLFVEQYSNLVYHTVRKTLDLHGPDYLYGELEDLHNGVFLSLLEHDYKKLRQYKGLRGCSVATWIMTISANYTLNFIRGTKQHQHESLDEKVPETGDTVGNGICHPSPSALEILTQTEESDLLRELVDGLDAGDRLFLKYYYEDELSPEEIATVMSVTVSAIYSKKSRILDKLRSIAKKKRSLQEK